MDIHEKLYVAGFSVGLGTVCGCSTFWTKPRYMWDVVLGWVDCV